MPRTKDDIFHDIENILTDKFDLKERKRALEQQVDSLINSINVIDGLCESHDIKLRHLTEELITLSKKV